MMRCCPALLCAVALSVLRVDGGAFTVLLEDSVVLSTQSQVGGELAYSLPLDLSAEVDADGLLMIAHRDVKEAWNVRVGGQGVGRLDQIEQPTWTLLPVPKDGLSSERSAIEILAPKSADQVELSKIVYWSGSLEELTDQASIRVQIEEENGERLPTRVTFLDEHGYLAPLSPKGNAEGRAVRTGVVYDSVGDFTVGIAAGDRNVQGGMRNP